MHKQKKNVRQRGTKTHGCGSMKKRRGAGNRGGRGMAGTGKRGDCKKPAIWKNKKYFGGHGFASRKKGTLSVNMMYIECRTDMWLKKGLIKENSGFFIIDLDALGFQKLLSKGIVSRKYKINCIAATKRAIEKIKEKGGEVTCLSSKQS